MTREATKKRRKAPAISSSNSSPTIKSRGSMVTLERNRNISSTAIPDNGN